MINSLQKLKDCLKYCEIQNGRSDCKNCGLDKEMILGIEKEFTSRIKALIQAGERLKKDPGFCCQFCVDKTVANYQELVKSLLVKRD